jgi:asparagine synthetase B (glutamine-hydrolysing)
MKTSLTNSFGDFTVFGFTKQPEILLQHTLPNCLGITPRVINFGSAGHFFFYSSYGEVAETEEFIGLKLGLARSRQRSPLSTKQLLEQGLLTSQTVDYDALRGNALVACFSKKVPQFCAYKTLLSLPQLFYSTIDGDLICTDTPQSHAALLRQVEASQEAIPQHFLFRYTLGRYSYFKNVYRLLPGELFSWDGNNLKINQVRTLRTEAEDLTFSRADAASITTFFEEMVRVMGAYIEDIEASGRIIANLLSGGVDSSLIQLLINKNLSSSLRRQSYSYAPRLSNFEFEVEYARQASEIFQTRHTFVEIAPEEFLGLMFETNDALAQPVSSEGEPCQLALAKYINSHVDEATHFFTIGTGADTLHGLAFARKINVIQKVRGIPGSSLILRAIANRLNPHSTKGHALRQIAAILPEIDNPDSFKVPTNTIATYTDIETARRCFGDDVVRKTLEYRRSLEITYLDTAAYVEKVHMIDFLSDAYENAVINNLIYLGQRREQITPFLDEDIIRLSRAFAPEVRYLNGRETKPLLKRILEQNSTSSVTKKPKGVSVFTEDLFDWMKKGFLRDLVHSIDRPAFVSKAEFDNLLDMPEWSPLDDPNWFLWNLLTFDIFQKRTLKTEYQRVS